MLKVVTIKITFTVIVEELSVVGAAARATDRALKEILEKVGV